MSQKWYLARHRLERFEGLQLVEWFIFPRAENFGEVFRKKTTKSEISVGDREGAILFVTCRTGMSASAFGSDHEEPRAEEEHRASAGRDGVHVELLETKFNGGKCHTVRRRNY